MTINKITQEQLKAIVELRNNAQTHQAKAKVYAAQHDALVCEILVEMGLDAATTQIDLATGEVKPLKGTPQ